MRNCLDFFWIFWGIFWRNFFGGILTLLKSVKLFEYGRIDLFVKILSQWRRKEDGRRKEETSILRKL